MPSQYRVTHEIVLSPSRQSYRAPTFLLAVIAATIWSTSSITCAAQRMMSATRMPRNIGASWRRCVLARFPNLVEQATPPSSPNPQRNAARVTLRQPRRARSAEARLPERRSAAYGTEKIRSARTPQRDSGTWRQCRAACGVLQICAPEPHTHMHALKKHLHVSACINSHIGTDTDTPPNTGTRTHTDTHSRRHSHSHRHKQSQTQTHTHIRTYTHLPPTTVPPESHHNIACWKQQHALHALAAPHNISMFSSCALHRKGGTTTYG